MLLNGSEMGTLESRRKYGLRGEYRLIEGSYGTFPPLSAMEFEEIITQTNTMTRADHLEIRLFHFFLYVFLDTKIFKHVEFLLPRSKGHGILQLIERLVMGYPNAEAPLQVLIGNFITQAGNELHATVPDRVTAEDVQKVMGSRAKLNPLYTVKLLFDPEVRSAFYRFVQSEIQAMVDDSAPEEMDAIFDYMDACIYPFDGILTRKIPLILDIPVFKDYLADGNRTGRTFLLPRPREYVFSKNHTYQSLLKQNDDSLTKAEKIYWIITHHNNESIRNALTYRLQEEPSV